MSQYLLTGATGFVGGHLAEACTARGWAVRALVRPTSDAAFLHRLGVQVVRGDLTDPAALVEAVRGVESVIHCAAKVGDWGPIEGYRAVNVAGLRNLLEACLTERLQRFIHLSSLGVYEARHHHGTDESVPPSSTHTDGYARTKTEAEQLALRYQRECGVPVVVLRPGFVYGPRDRAVLPRLLDKLRQRRVRYLSGGERALNTIYIDNLLDAVFAALERPEAIGQVYNLTDGEAVSKRRFIEALADGVGLPRPSGMSAPLWLVRWLAGWAESRARRLQSPRPPRLTQAMVKFLGLNLDFSIDKARRELGYAPRVSFDEAMRQTTNWYRRQAAEVAASGAPVAAAAAASNPEESWLPTPS
jgi:nucleoside-diphosphate-sugar epimerase